MRSLKQKTIFTFNINESKHSANSAEMVTLISQFETQANKFPFNFAVIYEDEAITYDALNKKANQLAQWLIANNIKTEDIVCVSLERSIEMLIIILATLKIGAAYLPIDPKAPANMIHSILSDASPKLFFCDDEPSHDLGIFSNSLTRKFCNYTKLLPKLTKYSNHNLDTITTQSSLAYIIYTSGSTGTPKGVEIEQRGIMRLVVDSTYVKFRNGNRVSWTSNPAFDASTFEIYGALLNGACLVICSQDTLLNPRKFSEYLVENKINILWLTTSLFNFLYLEASNIFRNLTYLVIGGEALNAKLVRNLFESNSKPRYIINGYGPTESTTFALTHTVNESDSEALSIPLGKPINKTKVYILNDQMKIAAENEIGQLYIGGFGLARGYLKQPELTKEKFISNPFSSDTTSRLYKTGDLVRQLPSGEFEYIGRIDEQIKIRGYRVEITAIEAHLLRCANIMQAAVIAKNNSALGTYLIAFLAPKAKHVVNLVDVKRFLHHEFPEYMIPNFYVILDNMPLMNNGKINKAKLQGFEENFLIEHRAKVPLETKTEKNIANIFSSLTGITEIYADDDFFELGGHSLLVLRLLSELESVFHLPLELIHVYEARTVSGLADIIQKKIYQVPGKALVELQKGNNRSTIFFFPPISGSPFCYTKLIENLESQATIYGLQDPSFEESDLIFDSIHEMASYYYELIKSIQPKGPYIFIGASFGTTLAIEVAKLFQRKNQKIAFIGLIDGWANLSKDILHSKIYNNTPSFLEQYVPFELINTRWKELILQRINLLFQHQYQRINIPLTLFKAEVILTAYRPLDSTYNGWEKYTTEPIQLFKIPGNHNTLLQGNNAIILAQQLRKCLNEAENIYFRL